MPDVSFDNLLAVAAIAFAAPLLLGSVPRLRIPAVVVEIVAGIVVGPSVLGWVEADLPVQVLAVMGLAFLLFLAGLEIDLAGLSGRWVRLSTVGFGVTVVLGLAVGLGATALGWTTSPLLVAIALSATSLGLVVPVLVDAGAANRPVGQLTIAASSVADFAAVLLLSLLFSASMTSAGGRVVLLGAFSILVLALFWTLRAAGRSMRLSEVLLRLQDTTAQIRVRGAVLLLLGFVALAGRFGLEAILGAFVAGAVVGLLDRDASSHPHLRTKLEAIGYGFLIPVFFVSSGLRLDLSGLASSPRALAQVPILLLALLAVRGLAALPYLPHIGARATAAAGLLQATSLPFIVTATQIGVSTGRIEPVTAAALVCAGLLSVLTFPAAALGLLRADTGPGRRQVTTAAQPGGAR